MCWNWYSWDIASLPATWVVALSIAPCCRRGGTFTPEFDVGVGFYGFRDFLRGLV
jgi:hypothetical protein